MALIISLYLPEVLKCNVTRSLRKTLPIISGEVTALRSVWLIDDDFLTEMYPIFAKMKNRAKISNRSVPFLFDYYNITCFTTNPLSVLTDTMTRIVNCVIKGLNESARLPRFIIVIPDLDVVRHVNEFGKGMTVVNRAAIKWIINQITRAVTAKHEDLVKKRPGVVISVTEPKFVWVKMVQRPMQNSNWSNARSKFNKLLENALVDKHNHYILDVNQALSANPGFFSSYGKLSGSGKVKFWQELDLQLEEFNNRKRSLRPIHQEMRHEKNLQYQGDDTRYRFPPPPKKKKCKSTTVQFSCLYWPLVMTCLHL